MHLLSFQDSKTKAQPCFPPPKFIRAFRDKVPGLLKAQEFSISSTRSALDPKKEEQLTSQGTYESFCFKIELCLNH